MLRECELPNASAIKRRGGSGRRIAKVLMVLAVALSTQICLASPTRAAGNLGRLAQQSDLEALFPAAERFDELEGPPSVLRARIVIE